jgi:hypothetical protein
LCVTRSSWYNEIRCASVGVPAVITLTETSGWDHDEQTAFLAAFEAGSLRFQAPQHSPIATVSVIERISYVFDPIDWSLVKFVEEISKFGYYFQQLSDLDRMPIDRLITQIDPKYFMVRYDWRSTVARHGKLFRLKRLLSLFGVRLSLIFFKSGNRTHLRFEKSLRRPGASSFSGSSMSMNIRTFCKVGNLSNSVF